MLLKSFFGFAMSQRNRRMHVNLFWLSTKERISLSFWNFPLIIEKQR